jgi:hypothetical protein
VGCRDGVQRGQSRVRPFIHEATIFAGFALDSVTMPWADKTARVRKTQKSQNRQCRDNEKRHHEGLPSSRF